MKIPYADYFSTLGDGTADYLVTYNGGSVEFYRNNGNLERNPGKSSWENLGVIAAGVQQQGIVIFGDIDGSSCFTIRSPPSVTFHGLGTG